MKPIIFPGNDILVMDLKMFYHHTAFLSAKQNSYCCAKIITPFIL
jgi:hypothetical protein